MSTYTPTTTPTTSEPTYEGPVYNGPIYSDKPKNDAEVLGVDHQRAGQVRQLLAERANCVAYSQPDRVKSIDVTLDMMGYTGDRSIGSSGLPVGRSSNQADVSAPRVTAATTPVSSATAKSSSTGGSGTNAGITADSSKKK